MTIREKNALLEPEYQIHKHLAHMHMQCNDAYCMFYIVRLYQYLFLSFFSGTCKWRGLKAWVGNVFHKLFFVIQVETIHILIAINNRSGLIYK